MAAIIFRNSLGELVDVPHVPATQLKNEFGAVLDRVLHGGAVAITRHAKPKAVLLSYAEFSALVADRAPKLEELRADYDVLLARMQTPAARKGMKQAFDAAPGALGRAAVKAARKHR